MGQGQGASEVQVNRMAEETREKRLEAILLPVLNEEDAIGPLLAELAPYARGRRLYLLDSASQDGTVAIARQAARACALDLQVLSCPPGLANSIRLGIERSDEDRLAVIDGDGQHDPKVLDGLFLKLKDGCDLAVGSRRVAGASVAVGWPRHRQMATAAALGALRLGVRCHGVRDPLSGCFALRRSAWRRAAARFDTGGYKFLLDFLAVSRGLRIAELPLQFRARCRGASHLALPVFWELLVSIGRGLLHGRMPRRWISFCGVGALGTATDATLTGILHVAFGVPFFLARPAPILAAMTQSYLLNNWLTFGDVRRRGASPLLRGWTLFAAGVSVGASANWAVSAKVYAWGVPWPVALLAGIAAGVVINFIAARMIVWRKGQASRLPNILR